MWQNVKILGLLFSLLCCGCPPMNPPVVSVKCNIHADCPDDFYCVLGECQLQNASANGSLEERDAGESNVSVAADAGPQTPPSSVDAGASSQVADAGASSQPTVADAGTSSQPTIADAGTLPESTTADAGPQNPYVFLDAGLSIDPVPFDAGRSDAGEVSVVEVSDAGHALDGIAWDASVITAPLNNDGGAVLVTNTLVVDDTHIPVDGVLKWSNNGFSFDGDEMASWTYSYRIHMTDPSQVPVSFATVIDWTFAGDTYRADIDLSLLEIGVWYQASVLGVRTSDSAQMMKHSAGFMLCPENYIFVPSNEALFEDAQAFCVAQFEMKLSESDDGDEACTCENYVGSECSVSSCEGPLASRPGGTPVNYVTSTSAIELCESIGATYGLISNEQWQLIARNIENQDLNWSGGSVGNGAVNQGHSDGDPLELLPVGDLSNPCTGTGNPDCTNRNGSDYSQKRTHILSNGAILWDFSGNLSERVGGSEGISSDLIALWQSFSDPIFTTSAGAEIYRRNYGPEGDYDQTHGMGKFYMGDTNAVRGGDYALGIFKVGIYSTHHKRWHTRRTDGLRCTFQP